MQGGELQGECGKRGHDKSASSQEISIVQICQITIGEGWLMENTSKIRLTLMKLVG